MQMVWCVTIYPYPISIFHSHNYSDQMMPYKRWPRVNNAKAFVGGLLIKFKVENLRHFPRLAYFKAFPIPLKDPIRTFRYFMLYAEIMEWDSTPECPGNYFIDMCVSWSHVSFLSNFVTHNAVQHTQTVGCICEISLLCFESTNGRGGMGSHLFENSPWTFQI